MTGIVPRHSAPRPGSDASRRGTERLAEVWGDVVDLRHLAAAVAIGATVSLGLYAASGWLLAGRVATYEVGRSYAMLAGLLGCVIGGAICAGAFPPKRTMTEDSGSVHDGAETLPLAGGDLPERGVPSTLPPDAANEMRALGLSETQLGHGGTAN